MKMPCRIVIRLIWIDRGLLTVSYNLFLKTQLTTIKMKKIAQYCQKCRSANEPGAASCLRCGTPLMIIVQPPGMRHDQFTPTSAYEDHLLERISLLEMRLKQLSDNFSLTLQVIGEQSQIMRDEHEFVRELYESLKLLDANTRGKVIPKWDEVFKKFESGSSPRISEILAAGSIKNLEMLKLLIFDVFEFIRLNDEQKTFATLRRAEPIAPKNVPLLLLYAEQLFYADKFDEAEQKLEKAFKFSPNDQRVRLLLGLIYADKLEIKKAESMTAFAFENERIKCAVSIISAMSAAFVEDWERSAECFEKSLEKFEFAESFYLSACVCFLLKKHEKSLEFCEKAITLDENFTDVNFLKMLNFTILQQKDAAHEAMLAVANNMEIGAQCTELFGANKIKDFENALPFIHFEQKKRLLTGGSLRIRKFIRSLVSYALNS